MWHRNICISQGDQGMLNIDRVIKRDKESKKNKRPHSLKILSDCLRSDVTLSK